MYIREGDKGVEASEMVFAQTESTGKQFATNFGAIPGKIGTLEQDILEFFHDFLIRAEGDHVPLE